MKIKNLLFGALILTTFSSCFTSRHSLMPFFHSIVGNVNVYKTQDALKVYQVYNPTSKEIFNDTTKIYSLDPKYDNSTLFLRYTLPNDSMKNVINILPKTKILEESKCIVYDPSKENIDIVSQYYYKIAQKKIEPYQQYLATEHITGIPLTIPFKYRFNTPKNLDAFSVNISIAYAFGYRVRINNNPYKENYIRALVITGIGTDKYIPKDSISNSSYKSTENIVWTYGLGATYESGNRLNFGLFLGWDRMFGNKTDWYFQNKPWLGFGFGYKFK